MLSLVQTSQNRRKELKRFLTSLNAQKGIDFKSIQLIFVDQGDCKESFKNLNAQIHFVYIKYKTSSLSHARNIGLKYVKGEFIAFPDDDDEITVVGMGGKIHLVLAPQDSGGLGGGSAHGFAGSIDDVPFALNSLSICHECGHLESSVYRDKGLIF